MAKWAVINAEGLVENVVLWDGVASWLPPDGCTVVELTDQIAGPRWTYKDGVFTPPVVVPVEPKKTLDEKMDELTALVAQLADDVKKLKGGV